MALRYKLKAMCGTYKKDGVDKTRYIDIGSIIDGKNGGFVMKLDAVPTGWDGWAILAEPEARPQGGQQQRGGQRRPAPPADPVGEMEDDIPF